MLGHKVSKSGMEIYKTKVEVIEKFQPPISGKGVRRLLGHANIYRRFIKDFSKSARPMCNLFKKKMKFEFYDKCLEEFEMLKQKLIEAFILIASNWQLLFEMMCDSSDIAVQQCWTEKE